MGQPVHDVQKLGQSIWYDNIRRGLITSGELHALVNEAGVLGVTSNPAIFEKAVAGSEDYDPALRALVRQGVGNAKELFERVAIEDIQLAADILYPVYKRTRGIDGYVSLEVSPHLAQDTSGTVKEALRLHASLGRDNVMIKVPATEQGFPAIQQLIAHGINVNVTLLFSIEAYKKTAEAYICGLEELARGGGDVSRVASVASFFISRIDSAVDARIEQELDSTKDPKRRTTLKELLGRVAISNAKEAYAHLIEAFDSERFGGLAARGARPQRLLWASTGTKNPKYSKTLYVDELIGPDTVNTMPAATFEAFRTSGVVKNTLKGNHEWDLADARLDLRHLADLGISLAEICERLLEEGLQNFSDAFDKLLSAVETKRKSILGGGLASQSMSLGDLQDEVDEVLDVWRSEGRVRKLWTSDTSLWTSRDENKWLGWLGVVEALQEQTEELRFIAQDVTGAGMEHVVLLGMGGSSLCPDVLRHTFARAPGFPEMIVLDSIVPAQIQEVEKRIDPRRTIFVVSSKSGTTTETKVLARYFRQKVAAAIGEEEAGSRFIAITDPGTELHKLAKAEGYAHILHGEPTIGGRYSALSMFGLGPAALLGIDIADFLDRAQIMVESCASCVPPEANPGVTLGVIVGCAAKRGRDKLTIVTSPGIESLGTWVEQLVAESTGKLGLGVIPVESERVGEPEAYGDDRLFVYARLASDQCDALDAAVDALEAANHPLIRLTIKDPMDIAQAFFRWEIATAVTGAVLGVNPFDQPDVEATKVATRRLTTAYEKSGELGVLPTLAGDDDLRVVADAKNAEALRLDGEGGDVDALIAAHLQRIDVGDYFAITAYLEMNGENHAELQAIRHAVRDAKKVATTLGYGPRFLHSTGQLHKGGPNRGVFLQITAADAEDIEIPEQRASFGVLCLAQANGDFEVLADRDRRIIRVHLGSDVKRGLVSLREIVERAL